MTQASADFVTADGETPAASGDLFDADLDAWRKHPDRAFDGWLARHGFARHRRGLSGDVGQAAALVR
jgi:hypothetical protein